MSSVKMAPTEAAFAQIGPGGPEMTAILERQYGNAKEQEILLATSANVSGQNFLKVQLFGPMGQAAMDRSRLRDGFLPIGNVSRELRSLFPGVRMSKSTYYVQNKYGPFGYATGRSSAGDTCFYGWQRITSTGMTQTLVGNKGSIQIRLRLCDQRASERRLLQTMYDFTINAYFTGRNWNPYGEAIAPDPSLGKPGAPIFPATAPDLEAEPAPVRSAPRSAAPRAPTTAAPAPPLAAPVLPAPIGPSVPPPPGQAAMNAGAGLAPPANTIVPPPPCAENNEQCR
jgi:hypothetical protein